jgi:hypothetical protein
MRSNVRTDRAAAYLRNERGDILGANPLGYALFSELYVDPVRPVNQARFAFHNPRATEFYVDWESVANDTVATLRTAAGRDPYDRGLSDLVGELSTRREAFRTLWAAHDVRFHRTGVKRFQHRVVGDLELTYETMEIPADPGSEAGYLQRRTRFRIPDRLNFLEQAEPADATDRASSVRVVGPDTSIKMENR